MAINLKSTIAPPGWAVCLLPEFTRIVMGQSPSSETYNSVKPLDLVITKMGDPPGDCEIYPENSPEAVLTADCLKFRLWKNFADRRFYKSCINSNLVRKQLGFRRFLGKIIPLSPKGVDVGMAFLLPRPLGGERSEGAGRG